MKSALITFNSKKGKTLEYAKDIARFLESHNISSHIVSVADCEDHHFKGADMVFFGCWTSGLMIIAQRPEKRWVDFAKKTPAMHDKKIVLFTTYLIATGSMFKSMQKHLNGKITGVSLKMKSRQPVMTDINKAQLEDFLKSLSEKS